ncbi:hypothetical protein [Halodesulfovibrio spirochaetisodalis]|uniref:Uncharacterized protein n=1 Tax=Halodesulfovibrio spirochaetisodalis TaxID=1560234 RepID=A0A1B7X9Q9_9BACT|nr:hypothetical protein [Halodesulfovibrio spirochaetisodalis]OBQ46062.1 hypothetical protein SP90_14275 [Halodesulfovibrio spirochaetisodalis]
MESEFTGSAYKSGKNECITCTYGIRSPEFRDKLRERSGVVGSIAVLLNGIEPSFSVKLTGGFWRNCPELKDVRIREWLASLGFLVWKKGSPPKFKLILSDDGKSVAIFQLEDN